MSTYQFETAEKRGRFSGGHAYKGASIRESGIYISKQTVEDLGLNDYNASDIKFDASNDLMLLLPSKEQGTHTWTLSKNKAGGISVGNSNTKEGFNERFGMKKGRYEFIGRHNDGYLFKFNPSL